MGESEKAQMTFESFGKASVNRNFSNCWYEAKELVLNTFDKNDDKYLAISTRLTTMALSSKSLKLLRYKHLIK